MVFVMIEVDVIVSMGERLPPPRAEASDADEEGVLVTVVVVV